MDELIGPLAAKAGIGDAVGTRLTAVGPGMGTIQSIARELFRLS